MAANDEVIKVDLVDAATWRALLALANNSTALTVLSENAEALAALAEKADELLALLEENTEP